MKEKKKIQKCEYRCDTDVTDHKNIWNIDGEKYCRQWTAVRDAQHTVKVDAQIDYF